MSLGKRLGRLLSPGTVLALHGGLGAGKTTFTKGLSTGLGLADEVHSPTFTLVHEHRGTNNLYHIDLYRLDGNEDELETIGFEEYLESDGVTVIEWAEKAQTFLPSERIDIDIVTTGASERTFTFTTSSADYQKVIGGLR